MIKPRKKSKQIKSNKELSNKEVTHQEMHMMAGLSALVRDPYPGGGIIESRSQEDILKRSSFENALSISFEIFSWDKPS